MKFQCILKLPKKITVHFTFALTLGIFRSLNRSKADTNVPAPLSQPILDSGKVVPGAGPWSRLSDSRYYNGYRPFSAGSSSTLLRDQENKSFNTNNGNTLDSTEEFRKSTLSRYHSEGIKNTDR